ncbi:MAG: EamA family transporter [Chitinophagaceae bacterium]
MIRFDIIKTLSQTGDSLKQLSAFNPLTIHKKGKRTKAIFALALVCFLWGTTWIGAKEGVKHMPALQMAGIRQLLGGICYVTFFIIKGAKLPKGKEWVPVIILSILNFALSNGLSNWGVQYISAGLGAIMAAIFPLWIVVIGLFSSKEKIPVKALIGLLLGFSGVCIIFYEHLNDFFNADFRFGIMLSLIATWTWAFGTLYTKKNAANFNPYFSLGLQMLISGASLLTVTKIIDSPTLNSFTPFAEIPVQAWLAISYLVVFGSVIAFIAYLYALQNLPTEQASIYAYVNPMVAVLLGWLLFSEHLSIFIGIGGVVTLLGVYLVNKAFKTIPPTKQPETEGM